MFMLVFAGGAAPAWVAPVEERFCCSAARAAFLLERGIVVVDVVVVGGVIGVVFG
jgi:hypothetical protein